MLLWADGFPYDTASLTSQILYQVFNPWGDMVAVLSTNGRYGGRYIHFAHHYNATQPNGSATRALPGQYQTLIVQAGYKMAGTYDGYGGWPDIISLMDGSTAQVRLCDESQYLAVYSGATQLWKSTTPIAQNVWHQIEFKAKIDASVGTVLLKVDGVEFCNLSNQNTRQGTSNAYATAVKFGGGGIYGNANGTHTAAYMSDFLIMDTAQVNGNNYCNDCLGARIVELKMPTGAGNYSQFTPSAGSNYQCADEIPPNTSDYNDGDVGEIDTFTKAALQSSGAQIDAVAPLIFCTTNDAGTASLRAAVRSNSVDGDSGIDLAVPSSFGYLQPIIYEDPNTSAPFTAANLNSAEFGYKRTA